ncbi:MAG: DUF5611 family protein [Thermoplasmata archaeon]|nr:DUF5611 family protein [Thermoplasmata archaeon]
MQKYPVRPSHRPNLAPAALDRILGTHFESVGAAGPDRTASWGAITRIAVHAEGRDLLVEVTMNPKVSEEVARETIARYNRFLEETCGYSSKERAKRLKKSATTPPAGA